MPLTRGQIVGYDAKRMVFEFTMVTADAAIIICRISRAAMDLFAGRKGTRPSEREDQFKHLRDAIERVASDNFDDESEVRGSVVQIFAKHIRL
jgi:hypothetical protein